MRQKNILQRFCENMRWVPTLAMLILCTLFLLAAYWQYSRAEQKQLVIKQLTQRSLTAPLTLATIQDTKDPQYYRIFLQGYFLNQKQILLDNKFYQHRVGYQVITPFFTDNSQKIILVNRGWIPQGKSRQHLPILKPINGLQTVTGIISMPTKSFSLGEASENTFDKWPLRVANLDISQIAKLLKMPVYPWLVLESASDKNGFIRDWLFITTKPEKHIAYAVQWLLMLFTLLIIYFVLTMRGNKKEKT